MNQSNSSNHPAQQSSPSLSCSRKPAKTTMHPSARQQIPLIDPHVIEYTSKPIFWLQALVIAAHGGHASSRHTATGKGKPASTGSYTLDSTIPVDNVSQDRCHQLIEGYWVVATATRVATKVFRHYSLVVASYSLISVYSAFTLCLSRDHYVTSPRSPPRPPWFAFTLNPP